jgi:iron complex transport system substrate-binding protein
VRILPLILAMLLPIPGLAAEPSAPPIRSSIEVLDDTGRRVQLAARAQRIVALSPHATELVFAAGAGDRLVAVAPYSDFPPAAARLPTIGGLGGLDRERLLALAPDLVIAWDSGNRPADLAWLDDLGIAVYRSEPRGLDDIANNLIDIGRLARTDHTAQQAADRYRQALANACTRPPRPSMNAFIRLAERPLLTVGGGHWMDRAISRAGLHNAYAELPPRALTVSEESLLARKPAVTLYLAYPGVTISDDTTAVGLDPALWARPGPRLPAGIAQLCHTLSSAQGAIGLRSEAKSLK